MNNIKEELENALSEKLALKGLELDVVPVPTKGDRMVRLRTLEEAFDEFELNGAENSGIGYLIQVRPTQKKAVVAVEDPDSIYLKSGKLNADYLFKNAILLHQAQDYSLAQNVFQKIIDDGQKISDCYLWIGRGFEAQGKSTEAKINYEQALLFGPTLEIIQTLANLLLRQKQDGEAAAVLERALQLENLTSRTRIDLLKAAANAYLTAQEVHTAERLLKRALELNPLDDSLLTNLGSIYLKMGHVPLAKKHLKDAIDCNQKSSKALTGYASCLLSEGLKREAHDTFAKSLDIDLAQPTALYHLIKIAYELKIYGTAARILENYCSSSPVNINLLFTLAGLQFHLGRFSDSRETARKILDLNPEYQKARDLLKRIEEKSKHFIKEDGEHGSGRRETTR